MIYNFLDLVLWVGPSVLASSHPCALRPSAFVYSLDRGDRVIEGYVEICKV